MKFVEKMTNKVDDVDKSDDDDDVIGNSIWIRANNFNLQFINNNDEELLQPLIDVSDDFL
jgi:hypothetical protein